MLQLFKMLFVKFMCVMVWWLPARVVYMPIIQ